MMPLYRTSGGCARGEVAFAISAVPAPLKFLRRPLDNTAGQVGNIFDTVGAMQKNKKQKIIALACEAEVLAAIVAIASPFYEVIKTCDPKRALMGIAEHAPVAAVIADHRLSGASGLTFLAAVQKRWPAVQRILLAEPEDMQQIIHGLHSGAGHARAQLVGKHVVDHALAGAVVGRLRVGQ